MHDSKDLIFTRDGLWIRDDGGVYTVGMSDEGLDEAGMIVFVELPEQDSDVAAGDAIGSTESVKTVSPIISPLSGRIVEVNWAVSDEPQRINGSPYGDGWLFRIRPFVPLTFWGSVRRGV